WPQAPGITERPKEEPVPGYLDWQAWLGPAPDRPYAHGPVNARNPKRGCYHDFSWRGWGGFGTGAVRDMACHTANIAFMALRLGHPTRVSAEAGDVNPEPCPGYVHATVEFPIREFSRKIEGNGRTVAERLPAVTLHWYEGKKDGKKLTPPEELCQKAIALDT